MRVERTLIFVVITWLLSVNAVSAANTTSVTVTFKESAPKDSFQVRNTGLCQIKSMTLNINLAKSRGRLIFDVTAKGAGVDVFQPFEIVLGRDLMADKPLVRDGDDQLSLRLQRLRPTDVFIFTIDVDDTLEDSALGQIRVAGSEIEGAIATVETEGRAGPVQASFSPQSEAVLRRVPCA